MSKIKLNKKKSNLQLVTCRVIIFISRKIDFDTEEKSIYLSIYLSNKEL